MGFLKRILRRIRRPDYDKEIRDLEARINELLEYKKAADKELEQLKGSVLSTPSLELVVPTGIDDKSTVKTFIPPKIEKTRSMKDLLEAREREEDERKRQLRQHVLKCFTTVKTLIEDKELERAEDLLFNTLSALQELQDEQLDCSYQELQSGINDIKEEQRQKEIRRKEEEARRLREEKERQLERELRRKQREEEERLEKERKAKEYEEKLAKEEEKRHVEIDRLTSIVTRKKTDGSRILEYLGMKGVRRFYHFTDKENLHLIKRLGGLYSWHYCEQNDISIPNPGGNRDSRRFDKRHGLEDYVRLSFCDDHPMAYRKHQEGSTLVLLYIDIEVAAFEETLFTDRNAASDTFACGGKLEDLQKVNIPATQRNYVSRNEGEVFSQHQAECMIKTFIPIRYITNIDNPKRMIF